MQGLSAQELLGLWERGRREAPPRRALTLLAAARRVADAEELLNVTIGARNAELLALREATFGPEVVAVAACTACGERAEIRFACGDLVERGEREPPRALELGDSTISFRPPTGADLLAVAAEPTADDARRALLRRCVDPPEVDLSDDEAEQLARLMADADPQADVRLAIACPACGHAWAATFDADAFLWSEIEARAVATLSEVDALASAYGWSEREILALTPDRRRTYLELVGS